MIKLCWYEAGELKRLELDSSEETFREVHRVEELVKKSGSPIAFLEHPVTYMMLPLSDSLLVVRRELARQDDVRMYRELARFIDNQDQSQRAYAFVSHQLDLANRDAQITGLEAETEQLRAEVSELEAQLGENRLQEAE